MTEIYRSEDAQQILQIAIARQADAGELTRQQLFEIASELNIAPDDLLMAEQEWQLRRGELEEKRVFDRMRRGKFWHRCGRFLIIGAFLIALDLLTGWNRWSLFILLLWGVGVALDAWKTYGLSREAYEEAFLRWRQRRQLKRSVTSWVNRWLGVA